MTTTQAIARSITHNEIVTLDYSDGARDSLSSRCDDSVDVGRGVEFWGRDDEGSSWRVHLQRRCPTCTSTDCPGVDGRACWTLESR